MDCQSHHTERPAAEFAIQETEFADGGKEPLRGNLHLIYNWIGKEGWKEEVYHRRKGTARARPPGFFSSFE
jgi:hypothetical protein